MQIQIIPQFVKQPDIQVDTVSIDINSLDFGVSATFRVELHNVDSSVVRFITISEDEYKNWSNDDTYMINLIFQKLGLKV